MNPLDGIEVAVTHREPPKGPGPAWLPQEQIALPEAIAGYTIGGAYLDFAREGDRARSRWARPRTSSCSTATSSRSRRRRSTT